MAALTAKASFKKENGALSISKTHLLWTPATRASGVIEESLDKIAGELPSLPHLSSIRRPAGRSVSRASHTVSMTLLPDQYEN